MANELKNGKWIKDFDGWNENKKSLDKRKKLPQFSERDIWYVSVGTNIGSETDGKNHGFERPVLVLKKFSDQIFLGIPMTSHGSRGSWFYKLKTKGYKSVAVLNQARLFSSKRLLRRVKYHVTTREFDIIRTKFKELI